LSEYKFHQAGFSKLIVTTNTFEGCSNSGEGIIMFNGKKWRSALQQDMNYLYWQWGSPIKKKDIYREIQKFKMRNEACFREEHGLAISSIALSGNPNSIHHMVADNTLPDLHQASFVHAASADSSTSDHQTVEAGTDYSITNTDIENTPSNMGLCRLEDSFSGSRMTYDDVTTVVAFTAGADGEEEGDKKLTGAVSTTSSSYDD
jgi:hypothetical protein